MAGTCGEKDRGRSVVTGENIGEARLRWLGHVERKTEEDQL